AQGLHVLAQSLHVSAQSLHVSAQGLYVSVRVCTSQLRVCTSRLTTNTSQMRAEKPIFGSVWLARPAESSGMLSKRQGCESHNVPSRKELPARRAEGTLIRKMKTMAKILAVLLAALAWSSVAFGDLIHEMIK